MKWARDGLLEGYRRGGRVLVTRQSVERFVSHPTVAEERAYERDLDEVLGAFDIGDDVLSGAAPHLAVAETVSPPAGSRVGSRW